MATTSSQIKITDLWKEHLRQADRTSVLVATRAQTQNHPSPLDLLEEQPCYSDSNGEDDDCLHPLLPGPGDLKPLYLLKVKVEPA